MSIAENIRHIRQQIPDRVQLICVSKFHPINAVKAAYDCGERLFGESHAQELTAKYDALPHDIEWHFIGSLQTNKVKYVVPRAALIHSVDSERLLAAIDRCAERNNLTANVLLEIHIARESTKHGFSPDEARAFFARCGWEQFSHTHICGLMTMGTATDDRAQTQAELHQVRVLFDELRPQCALPYFTELSMGMSDDFDIAIAEGSTMVRIGTAIFGVR
ncbi:MAG: YggS family pyridoxal phosphate-dependent enzyme [Paludibacteraceae bacterium]